MTRSLFSWAAGTLLPSSGRVQLCKAPGVLDYMQCDVLGAQVSCREDETSFGSVRFLLSTKLGTKGDCRGHSTET